MGALNHSQFAAAVNAGGASRFAESQQDPGLTPGLYAVADPHNERTFKLPVTRQQVQEHHAQVLAYARGTQQVDVMQGGWPNDGEAYLDSSRRVEGRRAAVALGQRNAQIAVFSHGRALAGDKPTNDVYMTRNAARAKMRELGEAEHKVAGQRRVGFTVEKR